MEKGKLLRASILPASLLILLYSSLAWSEGPPLDGLNLDSQDDVRRSVLSVGLEYASLSSVPALNGLGVSLGYSYAFSGKWRLETTISEVFNFSLSYLYTGIGIGPQYAILGSFTSHSHQLRGPRGLVVEETQSREKTLALGAGAEQLLLTGSTAVFPASGLFGQLVYTFPFLGNWWSVGVRAGSYIQNRRTFPSYFFRLSVPFGL